MAKDVGHEAEGRSETVTGIIDATRANMLGATILSGWDPALLPEGSELPALWHWAAFHPTASMGGLGTDGHIRIGSGFMPDLGLPRRMWAGGSLTFHRPLHVGEPLTRHSRIVSVEHKEGRTGPIALVTVAHQIEGRAGTAIEEINDIVYLEIPDSFRPPEPVAAPEDPDFDETVAMGPVRLFRYSAATFNGHRIHFDRPYATEVEHYPGLVVHGPLQATFLIDAATRFHGRAPDRLRYRGVHPMFDTHDLRIIGTRDGAGKMRLCTAAPAGHQGMQATAEWVE
ncbi:MAG: MaoC family dehydratase N-terminal domain-containing protein [Pseudomonadota bacterium]